MKVICLFEFKETGPNEMIWNATELIEELEITLAAMGIQSFLFGYAVASGFTLSIVTD